MSGQPGGLSREELRASVGDPIQLVLDKQLDRLDVHARAFIALSPFCVLSTTAADGTVDASPRGDPPGFVKVLDEHTLVIPDRRGNSRVDSMTNIAETGRAALLFMIPGTNETLRVNGRAAITDRADDLAGCAWGGSQPTLGIRIEITEVFMHCARALLRSKLWKQDSWPDRSALPTLGQILHDQTGGEGMSVAALDEFLDDANASLY